MYVYIYAYIYIHMTYMHQILQYIHMIYWVILLPSSSRWQEKTLLGNTFESIIFRLFPRICEFRFLEGIHPWRLTNMETQFPGGLVQMILIPSFSWVMDVGEPAVLIFQGIYTYRDPMATSTPFFHTSPNVSPLRGSIYLRDRSDPKKNLGESQMPADTPPKTSIGTPT